MVNEYDFSKKFLQLLIDIQERKEKKSLSKTGGNTGFHSVGDILASKKYQKHLEEKWKPKK